MSAIVYGRSGIMDLTETRSSAAAAKLAFLGKVIISVVWMASFGWFIAASLPRSATDVPQGLAAQVRPTGPRTMQFDTALQSCGSPEVRNSILGLLRTGNARIIGLSDIFETSHKTNGDRACRAVVNLDFGVQQISYTIERTGAGNRTWKLALTLR